MIDTQTPFRKRKRYCPGQRSGQHIGNGTLSALAGADAKQPKMSVARMILRMFFVMFFSFFGEPFRF
jgi:hypothetical protein